ncbi:hypothetical protein [Catenuloplanes atrovinosus]|uniref:Uncharacterized protein n=1 Tax=Catenuloplanes atrovinosus TaxID=137266 RepID=A0AAE3YJ82_9ACTN|nr:hypothetical protein [Catenuloplanes atrovinosus]MDR7274853.1 hypothetical protein [Catenuloplanes atrovinosus]
MSDDVVPPGQAGHPALADPEMRALIDRPGPDALARVAVLAAELVARNTGAGDEPLVAEALAALRQGLADGTPPRPGLPAELEALAAASQARLAEVPGPVEIGPEPSPAERLLARANAARAVAGALDPDPARAAWNVCWRAGQAVGRSFGDQLRLAVLDRCRDRAVRAARDGG